MRFSLINPFFSTLKGISVCFVMLKAALCGNYVNFGVFRLYGDDALDEALKMFVKLLISIELKNLLVSLHGRTPKLFLI